MVESLSINNAAFLSLRANEISFTDILKELPSNADFTTHIKNQRIDFRSGDSAQEILLPEKLQEELKENLEEFINKPEIFEKLLEQLNELAKRVNYDLRFGFFGESRQFFVQVFDIKSQIIVKIVPMRELLELREKILQQRGSIVDENV